MKTEIKNKNKQKIKLKLKTNCVNICTTKKQTSNIEFRQLNTINVKKKIDFSKQKFLKNKFFFQTKRKDSNVENKKRVKNKKRVNR